LLGRGKEQGFDARRQLAVHARQLEFVFEIGCRPQAAYDDVGAPLLREFHQQPFEGADLDVGVALQHLAGQRQALLQREHRLFMGAHSHADDDLIE